MGEAGNTAQDIGFWTGEDGVTLDKDEPCVTLGSLLGMGRM